MYLNHESKLLVIEWVSSKRNDFLVDNFSILLTCLNDTDLDFLNEEN
jgi:hypothetical protein